MMTDEEVIALYRCLLGRDPEGPDTIAAFKAYYETLDRGRRAIFVSNEFRTVFARTTGRVLDAGEHIPATLALALLACATPPAASAAEPAGPGSDPALAAGMRQFFEAGPRLAIVVGGHPGLRLADLAPFGQPEAAILHVSKGSPPSNPSLARLPDGTAVFSLNIEPAGVAALLTTAARPLDALYLLDHTATAQWMDVLRGQFAERTLVVLGPAQDGFDPAALEAAIRSRHHCEPTVAWHGLTLLQVGGWMLPVTYAPPAVRPAPPVRGAYPALAIAAIVRDEAVCVRNMLASTQPVASFYAVLDTGSRDATPVLTQAFLDECRVPHAYAQRDHTLFDDDFAAMRNTALAMVPDWIDWVLMLDADEELAPEDHAPLLALLARAEQDGTADAAPAGMPGNGAVRQNGAGDDAAGAHTTSAGRAASGRAASGQTEAGTPGAGTPALARQARVDAFALPRYNFPGADKSGVMMSYPDRQVRLLRNTPEHRVRYGGAVHETVQGTGHQSLPLDAAALGLSRGGPHIHHLVRRFRTPEEEERKQAFYREIAARRK